METFDAESYLKSLGWERVYKGIDLFRRREFIAFPPVPFDFSTLITEKYTRMFIYNICCHTIISEEDQHFGIPILVSDFFAHRGDMDNELIWATVAMKENPNIKPTMFSLKIRDKLLNAG